MPSWVFLPEVTLVPASLSDENSAVFLWRPPVVVNLTTKEPPSADGAPVSDALSDAGLAEWFRGSKANAYLRLSSCIQPIDHVGRRVAIEGAVHHIAGERGSDLAEVIDLTVKVLSRKGAPLGTYRILPRLDGALGVALGAYFCSKEGFPVENSSAGPVHLSAKGKQADEILSDLSKIVGRFNDASWQSEAISDLALRPGTTEIGTPSDDSAWERLRNAEASPVEPETNLTSSGLRQSSRGVHMVPILPSFPELAKDPCFALDRQWRSSTTKDGVVTTVTATLMPGETDLVAFDIVRADSEGLPVGRNSHTVGVTRKATTASREQVHQDLERVTAEAMDEFRRSGLDALIEKISQPPFGPPRQERQPESVKARETALADRSTQRLSSVDQNIMRGQRHEGETIFLRTLPSGAELKVIAGAKAALLAISPNSSELSSWIGWTTEDRGGVLKESSLVRTQLLEYAEMLSAGTREQKLAALEGLRALSARKNGRPHGGSGSADRLLGFGFDADLKSFGGVVVSASAPAFDNDEQILETLSGIELLQITKFTGSRRTSELANFDRALFGIYPDHSLSVRSWNSFGGQLRAKLCSATCEANGGYQEIIRTVAEILSDSEAKQAEGRNRTREQMQGLLLNLVNHSADANTIESPFDERRGMRIPPLNRPEAIQAYDRSAKLAGIWSKVWGGDPGEMRLGWLNNSDLCLASFERLGPRQLDRLDLLTCASGVSRAVGIFSLAQDSGRVHALVAEFAEPLRSGEDLRELFRLAQLLSESLPTSASQVESSALAKFLTDRKAL